MDSTTRTPPAVRGDVATAPTPEVPPAVDRSARPAADTRRILQAYAAYPPGSPARGAVLRRAGMYTAHIATWRKQRDRGALARLTPQPRGPKPPPPHPLADDVARLRAAHAR